MGIYISGVKGLPEQVQENKEKIATIEEEIEGIDFDAIHNLENQVAENTEDINNMEGTIGTQNIAITNLGGRLDTLEGKTQHITADATKTVLGSVLDTSNDINLSGDLVLDRDNGGNITLGDINKIKMDINYDSNIGFNSNEEVEIKSDGVVYEFTNNTIQVNGTPIGGSTLYQHSIRISDSSALIATLTIINDSNAPLNYYNTIREYLYSNGYDSVNRLLMGSGVGLASTRIVLGFYATATQLNCRVYDFGSANETNIGIPSSYNIYDTVVAL